MPRKAKAFKSRRREAQQEAARGNSVKANEIWRQIILDKAKLKADKKAKKAK